MKIEFDQAVVGIWQKNEPWNDKIQLLRGMWLMFLYLYPETDREAEERALMWADVEMLRDIAWEHHMTHRALAA